MDIADSVTDLAGDFFLDFEAVSVSCNLPRQTSLLWPLGLIQYFIDILSSALLFYSAWFVAFRVIILAIISQLT